MGWGRRDWGWLQDKRSEKRELAMDSLMAKKEEGQESSSNLGIADELQVSSDRR